MVDVNARRKMCTLVAAAFIDGHFAQEEYDMILRKGQDMGLPKNMIKEIIELGKKGSLAISVPPTQKQKEELLDDLIDIACADGKLEKEENHLLMKFSRQLGLSIHDLGGRVKQRLTDRRPAPPPRDVIEDGIVILEEEQTKKKPRRRREPEPVARKTSPPPAPPKRKPTPPPERKEVNIGNAYQPKFRDPYHKESSSPKKKPKYGGMPENPAGTIGSGEDIIQELPPGPVQLDGPGLGRIQGVDQIGIVTEGLLKQVLLVNSRDSAHREGIEWLKKTCGIEDEARCDEIINEVIKRNPDILPGALHDERWGTH